MPSSSYDDEECSTAWDWSVRLAHELASMWDRRAITLPMHWQEAAACRKLARKISDWGPVRSYALFACPRHFWRSETLAADWWRPEVWLASRPDGA